MKLLKISAIALLTLAFSTRPSKIAEPACAGGYDEAYSYHFFEPFSFSEFSDFFRKPELSEDANLQDWLGYLNNKPKLEDVREVVYKFTADDMQKVRGFVSNNANIPENWKKNSLVKYWQGNKDLQAIDYLFYAKKCEAQAGTFDSWEEAATSQRKDADMRWLADAGKKYYQEKAGNDFLRVRFAYQAIRMAHYSKQFKKGVDFYEELARPLEGKTQSPILYWALAHKAGCLMRMNKAGEANYLFAQVFDKCPSKRVSSALSWEVSDEKTWNEARNFCKNPAEFAALHFVRAVRENGDDIAEMESIYQKMPDYDKLPILLLREINHLENAIMHVELDGNLWFLGKTGSSSPEESAKKLQRLQKFVGKCVAEGKTQRKDLFALASAYLDFVAGNSAQAMRKLEEAEKTAKDAACLQQAKVFKLAFQLATLPKVDENTENELYQAVEKTNYEPLRMFMWRVLEKLYSKQNEAGKAELCWRMNLVFKPRPEVLDQLITLADKKKKTAIEEAMLKKLSKNAKAYLQEIKATYLFSQDRLQEAITLYEQIPADMLAKISENPLGFSIPHYVTYPDNAGKDKFNRMTLAYKLMNLKKMAENANIDQAQQYFQIGCIYYNLTYFGNSWEAIDYHRSAYDIQQAYTPNGDNFVNFDCGKAKFYFEKAMNVALKDQNKELGAKAAYMAAKCEQNQFYTHQKNKDNWGFIEPTYAPEHRRYFATLKKEFADTKYYKDILRECSYFNTFVKRK